MEATYDGLNATTNNNQAYNLSDGMAGETYTIKAIETHDEDMKNFLFTLGCFENEEVTIINRLQDNMVITIKDARYSIDDHLAEAIIVY